MPFLFVLFPFDSAQEAFLRWLSGVEAFFEMIELGFFRKKII